MSELDLSRIYRGRDSNRNFVYGSLIYGLYNQYITIEKKPDEFTPIKVDPKTVGVCTGFKDVKDRLIFENDWIKSRYGKKFLVVLFNGSVRAKGESGFYYDLEQIQDLELIAE